MAKENHGEKEENRKATGKEKERGRKERRKEAKEKETKEKEKERDPKVGASTAEAPTMREIAPKRAKARENNTQPMDYPGTNLGKAGHNQAKMRENPSDNWRD